MNNGGVGEGGESRMKITVCVSRTFGEAGEEGGGDDADGHSSLGWCRRAAVQISDLCVPDDATPPAQRDASK